MIIQFSKRSGLTAAALVVATAVIVPLNMGGCAGDALTNVGSVGSALTGSGGGGGSTGNKIVDYGGAAVTAAKAMNLGERDEDAMGQSVALAATNQYGLDPDDALQEYVNLVGNTVASVSSRGDRAFYFGVLAGDGVNAFSGPNGYVMITRGAVARMRDESELAGVLAHEVAHVCNRDGLNAVRQAGLLTAGQQAAAASDARVAQLSSATNFLVDQVLKKGYSRDQETAADAAAVQLTTAAGYDPNGYLRFLQRLDATGQGSGGAMSTHPGTHARVAAVGGKIAALGPAAKGVTLADRFQQRTRTRAQ